MAFLAANIRKDRVFRERKRLAEIPDWELTDYRLTRQQIYNLVEDYRRSEQANLTERSHAIPAETQVIFFTFSN